MNKQMPFSGFVLIPMLAALVGLLPAPATAQTYPSRPIRIVVPNSPGGSNDLLARTIAHKIAEPLGQPVIVENRPGSGGVIGTDFVAKAAPDGHTILVAYGSHVVNPGLYPKLPYDTNRDFAAITQLAIQPLLLLVGPTFPAKDVSQFIALARAKPREYNYSTSGAGSTGHVATELLSRSAGIELVHIPYKGINAAMQDVMSGQVHITFVSTAASLTNVRSGRLRPLAVSTRERFSLLPDVPPLAEAANLPGFDVVVAYFALVPAATPKEIVARLNTEIVRALRSPDVTERLARDGAVAVANSPAECAAYIGAEIQKWSQVVKQSGARAD